jgi:hypothetical protein
MTILIGSDHLASGSQATLGGKNASRRARSYPPHTVSRSHIWGSVQIFSRRISVMKLVEIRSQVRQCWLVLRGRIARLLEYL